MRAKRPVAAPRDPGMLTEYVVLKGSVDPEALINPLVLRTSLTTHPWSSWVGSGAEF